MAAVEMCQKCNTAVAEVTIIHFENGQKKHQKLCEECAKGLGKIGQIQAAPEFFKKFASHMFGGAAALGQHQQCPNCQLTIEQFEETGLLGCEECYRTFAGELTDLLCRVHGSSKHIGSRPRSFRRVTTSPLTELKHELQQALKAEDFENAAKYRDMIRDAEMEQQRQPGKTRR